MDYTTSLASKSVLAATNPLPQDITPAAPSISATTNDIILSSDTASTPPSSSIVEPLIRTTRQVKPPTYLQNFECNSATQQYQLTPNPHPISKLLNTLIGSRLWRKSSKPYKIIKRGPLLHCHITRNL